MHTETFVCGNDRCPTYIVTSKRREIQSIKGFFTKKKCEKCGKMMKSKEG
jgi:hypothetical protein